MAAEGWIDALSQFKLEPVFGPIGASLHFSQANVMMVVASVLTLRLMWVGMSPRAMIPGRLQSAAEMAYETVMTLCVEKIGPEGKKFFPFVFTLFFFILFGNLMGVFPLFLHLHQPHRRHAGAVAVRVLPGDVRRDSKSTAALLQLFRAARACRWC